MRHITHMCLDVKGFLSIERKKSEYEIFEDGNGKSFTKEQTKKYLLDELSKGHLFLPIGECDNFDYSKGCQGHEKS
jgi:hypothetical protein